MNSRLPLKIDLFYFKSDNKKKLMLNLKIDQKKKLKKLKKLKKKKKINKIKNSYFISQKYYNLIFLNSK
jgi:hypothetical protein